MSTLKSFLIFVFVFVPFFGGFFKFQISIGQGWGEMAWRTERHSGAPPLANLNLKFKFSNFTLPAEGGLQGWGTA